MNPNICETKWNFTGRSNLREIYRVRKRKRKDIHSMSGLK